MPATFMLVFVIFVDPCLVKRTKLFRQPSGSDEALARSSYGAATNCSGWARSDRQLPAAECTPRQAIPLRTTTRYTMALLQGWAKAHRSDDGAQAMPRMRRAHADPRFSRIDPTAWAR